jgi:hypothetical protein
MARFLVLYRAPVSAREQMANVTPEHAQAGMDLWREWAGRVGDVGRAAKPPFAQDQDRGPGGDCDSFRSLLCSPRAASGTADAAPLDGGLHALCGSPCVVYRRAMADPATHAGRPGWAA